MGRWSRLLLAAWTVGCASPASPLPETATARAGAVAMEPPRVADPLSGSDDFVGHGGAAAPEGIGLGSIGAIGRGAGSGSGYGRGAGGLGTVGLGAEPPVEGVPIPEPKPSDPLARVQVIVDGFGLANIAFNPPETMVVGDRKLVELLLSPEETQAALRAALPDGDRVSAETAAVQVAPRMEARLAGLGFAIESLGPVEQVVSRTQRTRWLWAVVPTTAGVQPLHLSLSARIDVDGHDTPFVVRTFDREIVVRVTTAQRAQALLSEHGSWAWSALAVPLLGFLWKRHKQSREQRKADGDHG